MLYSLEPSRSMALQKFQHFLPNATGHYASYRNYDYGPIHRDNVSGLSPYISKRLITELEVVRGTLAKHSASAAEKFIQEVLWRTYWKGWLELRPQVWQAYRTEITRARECISKNPFLADRYYQALSGKTGIHCYDTWLSELIETGYLHNHTRMWFASIWIFTLELPWALGAELFYQHLLDGDPASNTLSWRWVAGLHTPGKHYLARASNIKKYTNGCFNPQGQLREQAKPIPGEIPYPVIAYESGDELTVIPDDLGLLVFPEDLTPEISELSSLPFRAAAGVTMSALEDSYTFSDGVKIFTNAALDDGGNRIQAHWQIPFTRLEDNDLDARIENWCHQYGLKSIVALKPTQGPWHELCARLRKKLQTGGIDLLQIRRTWDKKLHPLATRGYFAFKQKIPPLMDDLLAA